MVNKLNDAQRLEIRRLLSEGKDRVEIATAVGVTPGQVSAVGAHVKMGTYSSSAIQTETPTGAVSSGSSSTSLVAVTTTLTQEHTPNLLTLLQELHSQNPVSATQDFQGVTPVWIGTDAQTAEGVYWNTDPKNGAANPHLLILGNSGFGKTYSITGILAELAKREVVPVVFDYGQGFTSAALPPEFLDMVDVIEINAAVEGVDINPFQIFPNDVLGPLNVAQRIADTFERVYPRLGIQQHAVLRRAALETLADAGIVPEDRSTWGNELPAFRNLELKLRQIAETDPTSAAKHAATVSSHISTVFVFNTFRPGGRKITWNDVLQASGSVFILQLKGLEASLEKVVTEFLLWNMIGYFESMGQGPLRCFAVLDEAHKLSCEEGSPVEYLLRVARKYGLGLILASQQPEDFSPVAFANTATKMVFQVNDERGGVASCLHRAVRNRHTYSEIASVITRLPRGICYFVSENIGRVAQVASFEART